MLSDELIHGTQLTVGQGWEQVAGDELRDGHVGLAAGDLLVVAGRAPDHGQRLALHLHTVAGHHVLSHQLVAEDAGVLPSSCNSSGLEQQVFRCYFATICQLL